MKTIKAIIITINIAAVITFCSDDDGSKKSSSCQLSPQISTEGALNPFSFDTTALADAEFKIMSRNLYLGADISIIIEGESITEIFQNTGLVFEDIIESEFPRRAEGLAREIEQIDPDIVALQEVVTIYTGDPDFLQDPSLNADCVEYDFLQILMDALEARGLSYTEGVISENADIELTDTIKDIRLADRDVILLKSGIQITESNTKIFNDNFTISAAGYSIEIERSYSEVLVTLSGNSVWIVNTHLEVPGVDSSVNIAQAEELKNHIENDLISEDYPIIITGDFNSGPNTQSLFLDTYNSIMLVTGIHDTWKDKNDPLNGYTCCYSDDLQGEPEDLSWRIDHIFHISPGATQLTATGAMLTEQDTGEKIIKTDDSTIWSSDHAGIAAGFAFP